MPQTVKLLVIDVNITCAASEKESAVQSQKAAVIF